VKLAGVGIEAAEVNFTLGDESTRERRFLGMKVPRN